MMKIGLFYGSTTCYTEMIAEKIQQALGEQRVDLFNVKDTPLTRVADYEVLIFGISTWDFGEIQEDWSALWEQLPELPLQGKTVALFGLGDQVGYGEWFLDAMGMLHDEILPLGPTIIGYWPTEGYEFEASRAVTEDGEFFVGLALDEESQYELTDERIEQWLSQLQAELAELGVK